MTLTIRYKLYPQDFLRQVLYYNSKSRATNKKTRRVWIFVIIFIIVLLILLNYIFIDHIKPGHYLGAIPVAILGAIMFPYFNKHILKTQLSKHVHETYKHNFGKETKLTLLDDSLEINNSKGQSKVDHSTIRIIIEIKSHFFVVLKTDTYIIVPKSEMADIEKVRKKLINLATKNKIPFQAELDWKWL